ncbi:MAG TPA: hypothetical protein VMT52_05585, partial [Planctomycetota bacterium]|nr:hypothetical protein [Planctomycetota bacterium]
VKQAAFLDYGNWGHQHSGREAIGHTRYDWVHAKLTDTRRFDVIPAEKEVVKGKEYVYEVTNRLIQKTPEELLKMPLFPFHDDEERVDAVVTFLAGLTKDRIPLEKTRKLVGLEKDLEDGSRLIASLNCKGCHRIGAEPQFVHVSALPRFSQYTETEENTRRGEMEKETWLGRDVRLHASNPEGSLAPPKEGGVLLEKGFLVNHQVFDRTTMDPENDDSLSVVELAAGPTNVDSKIPGHFAAFNVPESSRFLPVAAFEEGRIRFYFGTSADQRPNAPPPLVKQGERVQGDWLFRFLQDVTPLRLWLEVRMPSFYLTQDEARTIVRWFQANAGVKDSNEIFDEDTLNPEVFEKGQALFGPSVGERVGLQCNSCHPTGDKLPTEPVLTPARKFDYKVFQEEVTIPDDSYYVVWRDPNGPYRLRAGFADAAAAADWARAELRGVELAIGDPWSKISWGPDLGLAAERLRPPWIRQWLENPPDFMPGTKMPNFFGERSPVEGRVVLKPPTKEGEDRTEVKIQSIIQFLMHMENNRGGAQKTAAGN